MGRLGRLFSSRIALALLGMALVGGGGAYWAVASGAPSAPQASSSLTHTDPTSAASAEDPTTTTTTDPGATATATIVRRSPTPRSTATPCLTPTPVLIGQSVHWRNRLVSVNTGASTFALAIACGAHPAIVVDSNTTWPAPGLAKSISGLTP